MNSKQNPNNKNQENQQDCNTLLPKKADKRQLRLIVKRDLEDFGKNVSAIDIIKKAISRLVGNSVNVNVDSLILSNKDVSAVSIALDSANESLENYDVTNLVTTNIQDQKFTIGDGNNWQQDELGRIVWHIDSDISFTKKYPVRSVRNDYELLLNIMEIDATGTGVSGISGYLGLNDGRKIHEDFSFRKDTKYLIKNHPNKNLPFLKRLVENDYDIGCYEKRGDQIKYVSLKKKYQMYTLNKGKVSIKDFEQYYNRNKSTFLEEFIEDIGKKRKNLVKFCLTKSEGVLKNNKETKGNKNKTKPVGYEFSTGFEYNLYFKDEVFATIDEMSFNQFIAEYIYTFLAKEFEEVAEGKFKDAHNGRNQDGQLQQGQDLAVNSADSNVISLGDLMQNFYKKHHKNFKDRKENKEYQESRLGNTDFNAKKVFLQYYQDDEVPNSSTNKLSKAEERKIRRIRSVLEENKQSYLLEIKKFYENVGQSEECIADFQKRLFDHLMGEIKTQLTSVISESLEFITNGICDSRDTDAILDSVKRQHVENGLLLFKVKNQLCDILNKNGMLVKVSDDLLFESNVPYNTESSFVANSSNSSSHNTQASPFIIKKKKIVERSIKSHRIDQFYIESDSVSSVKELLKQPIAPQTTSNNHNDGNQNIVYDKAGHPVIENAFDEALNIDTQSVNELLNNVKSEAAKNQQINTKK